MESNFIDYVKIYCRSGKGGAGAMHLHREKYVEKGGPDGGNGGHGGSVYLRGSKQHWTLIHLKYKRHIFAPDGVGGGSALCTGADGKDIYVDVPLGTTCRSAESVDLVCEITEDNQTYCIARGGRGGMGNAFFKTSTRQTPRFSQPGEPAQEDIFILELKLLADVGLVGFPNAGKSTMLAAMSAAKPKIADYPFTTLQPNLGIVKCSADRTDNRSFVMADIPGIIEGASEGKGLGLRFLRHIERNSLLLFVIPVDCADICREYEVLTEELRRYNPELLHKKRLLAITKTDIADTNILRHAQRKLPKDVDHIFISAATGDNVEALKNMLWQQLNL
jgi:GTP-binding protein